MAKVIIDKDKCLGCGTCAMIAPEVFSLGADGKAEGKSPVEGDLAAKAKEAAGMCPQQAITIEE